eukprot:GEMP01026445.1.p1 GENE.GEMP01026445.1~~GEMP01026445.1.p1  ORF type:complete len:517 (+),score=62.95 GEMP01026445.1:45-1595(+)
MWEKRDCVVCAIYAWYMGMVFVGSYYYSWTPVCFFYPLLGPKSKAGMFLNKKYVEIRKHMLEALEDHAQSGAKLKAKAKLMYLAYKLNVPMCMYLGVSHLLAVHALFVLIFRGGKDDLLGGWVAPWSDMEHPAYPIKRQTLYFAVILWPITAMGITAGSHRLWAHRSYQAHWLVRLWLMICSSMANQGSILHWSRDHRTHHKHSDTDADPHNANRGFFFSHCGWLLVKKSEACVGAGRKIDISDLKKDPIVMMQYRADPWWNLALCFAIPAFFSVYFWEETLWNAFLVVGVLRYVLVLHVTWSVNSIVHAYGPNTYDPTELPAESRLVSFFAMGEGWHSWHHAFAFDYATAELGCLQQYNPTKFFLDCLAAIGLVTGRKRGTRMWNDRKERWMKTRNCDIIESLRGPPLFKYRTLEFVPKNGTQNDGDLQKVETIVPAAERRTLQLTKESFMNMIPEYRLKKRWSYFAIARDCAYLCALYSLPWCVVMLVLILDIVVPATWVTPGRRTEKYTKWSS